MEKDIFDYQAELELQKQINQQQKIEIEILKKELEKLKHDNKIKQA